MTVASGEGWTLIHGDCLQVLPTLEAGSVDAVITDPPYGMKWNTNSRRFTGGKSPKCNRKYGDGRSDWGRVEGDSQEFDPLPWLAFPRVVLWGANHYAAKLPVGTSLIWIKKADHLFGSFLSDAEIGWMKGGHGVYCFRKQFPPPTRMKQGIDGRVAHPTQKPIELMEWCLDKAKVPRGATVLDPYMGSGSTGVACLQTGRRFIGIELDAGYFEIARQRLETASAQARLAV